MRQWRMLSTVLCAGGTCLARTGMECRQERSVDQSVVSVGEKYLFLRHLVYDTNQTLARFENICQKIYL